MTVGLWLKPYSLLRTLLRGAIVGTDFGLSESPQLCDLLVSDGTAPDEWRPCECQIAVVPGDADTRFIRAGRVVTYGLSKNNTITVSSMTDKYLMLAVQKEIVGLNRKRVQLQEFMAPRPRSVPPETALAAASALVALGIDIS
ncbi:hypothetical protein FACS18949_03880 [Clostridia bacterium]|nr:hypothetical protein FACS18949_03880 [Clostridia bacterium]